MNGRPPHPTVGEGSTDPHHRQLPLQRSLGFDPGSAGPVGHTPAPRDSQRSKVYRAESAVTDTNLGSLIACGDEMERVAGSAWWTLRFPELANGRLPRLRPGNGARRAFYRPDPEPSITLPRRYRLQGVVLHEMMHWALDGKVGLADHGPTFTRLLLDATTEFTGKRRANALARAYADNGVRIGAAARVDDHGCVRYGWDERLQRRRHQSVAVTTSDVGHFAAVFLGWGRGKLTIRLELAGGERTSVAVGSLVDVEFPRNPAPGDGCS